MGYPWAVRAGGPLLQGGQLSSVYTWIPEQGAPVPPGSTFTRASSAIYWDSTTFNTVGVDVVRDAHYAYSGAVKGYISEPAATNVIIQSSGYTSGWTNENLTITPEGASSIGLDGNLFDTGITVVQTHRVFIAPGSAGPASCYAIAEAGSSPFIVLRKGAFNLSYSCFDLTLGSVTEDGSDVLLSNLTELRDGIYHCFMSTASAQATAGQSLSDSGTPGVSNPGFAGNDDTIRIFHFQAENGNFTTTPIVTAGAEVTREADIFDTGQVIASEYGALLDLTVPEVVGTGNTVTLLGADATAVDVLRIDASLNLIMDDGGTPVTIGTVNASERIKVAYGRDAAGRAASLNGGTTVTGGAPGAAHQGNTFQLGAANSVNQSRSVHHLIRLYDFKPTNSELESLSA